MLLRRLSFVAGAVLAAATFWYATRTPSSAREWAVEQSRLPLAHVDGDQVRIRDVRNFRWNADGGAVAFEPAWEERSYRLEDLDSMWYVLSPFGRDWRGPAHGMLSFGFSDTAFVAISVEARKETGESYSIWRGLLRQFELAYIVADERDVIGLRANAWDDDVYVYPLRVEPDRIRSIFVSMLERANRLHDEPAFYDTFRTSCTTTLLSHANAVASRPIRGGYRVLLPGYSDELLHSRGLLRTDLSLDAARDTFRVNDRATPLDETFSLRIRTPQRERRT